LESDKALIASNAMDERPKVQKANGVTHLIVERVDDLSADLKRVSGLNVAFPLVSGRGDEAKGGGGGTDRREPKQPMIRPRDMSVPDLHIYTLKVKTRNFARMRRK
jgi:error-prone DNA polymerase